MRVIQACRRSILVLMKSSSNLPESTGETQAPLRGTQARRICMTDLSNSHTWADWHVWSLWRRLTCHLFVRQRGDGQQGAKLLQQTLVQPIKVLVAMIDRSVGGLKDEHRGLVVELQRPSEYCRGLHQVLYGTTKVPSVSQKVPLSTALTLGVIWYSMKLLSPYSLDSFFGSAMTLSRGEVEYSQTGPTSPI